MHRFQTKSVILRIRIASLLVCVECLLIPATIGGLAYSLVIQDQKVAMYALILLPITVLFFLLQILSSTRTNCPLCMMPVLGAKSCNKHKNAFHLCGSYKLPVALSALFRGYFRCPYCNEASELKLRDRRG